MNRDIISVVTQYINPKTYETLRLVNKEFLQGTKYLNTDTKEYFNYYLVCTKRCMKKGFIKKLDNFCVRINYHDNDSVKDNTIELQTYKFMLLNPKFMKYHIQDFFGKHNSISVQHGRDYNGYTYFKINFNKYLCGIYFYNVIRHKQYDIYNKRIEPCYFISSFDIPNKEEGMIIKEMVEYCIGELKMNGEICLNCTNDEAIVDIRESVDGWLSGDHH